MYNKDLFNLKPLLNMMDHKQKPGPKVEKSIKEARIAFTKVCKLVESGFSVSEALKRVNFNRNKFYRYITPEQKQKLKVIKTLNSKGGRYY